MLVEGQVLRDQYRVIRPLGAGGQGMTYLVEDLELRRKCVAKAAVVPSAAHVESLREEARTLARFNHPNLPTVFTLLFESGYPYLIMQYIEGENLDMLADQRDSPFDVNEVLQWTGDLLDALRYLHSRRPAYLHRDVKPSNVRITPDGRAVLLDLGIARRADSIETESHAQRQTQHYSPIEQYLSAVPPYPTVRNLLEELKDAGIHTGTYSDVYSLAATLYFALTLEHPPDACYRVINECLQPVDTLNPSVPPALARALTHALIVDPRKRCQTVEEFEQLLEPVLSKVRPRKRGERKMYTAEISRANPTCFLFLIDQSYSMADPFGDGTQGSKATKLADIMNNLLNELIGRCTKGEGIRRYFQVGVIGYGASVGPALSGKLAGQKLVWVDELAQNARFETRSRKEYDGAGGLLEIPYNLPVWLEAVASNGTPMCQAFWQAHTTLEDWISQHRTAFPPTVINVTDGEWTDADPYPASEAIRELSTDDGNVLLLNLHLSSRPAKPVYFPDSEDGLPDEYACRLFRMSSCLTPDMRAAARGMGYHVSEEARGFIYNAETVDVIQFLNIGTMPKNR